MTSVSPIFLLRRFGSTWRQEGLSRVLAKTRSYVARRWGQVPKRISQPSVPEAYLLPTWQSLAQQDAFHVTASPALLSGRRQIAMIGDLNLPQCRKYRVEQMAAFWQARDVGFDFAHFEDVPRATRILQHATHVMEYRLQSTPLTQMLRYEAHRLRLPVLYDLDDPLFSVSAYETYGNMTAIKPALKCGFVHDSVRYLAMMNGADVVSVSTPGLAAHAALYTKRPMHVRRNFADAETLAAAQHALAQRDTVDGLFRVAFASGSQGHEADLATILEQLTIFILAASNRRLMVLGHFDITVLPAALRERVEAHPFKDYASYLADLARADCAVVPLSDDAFNRCKSGVRVLDGMAVAVPSLVADVGDLGAMVQHAKTGFIASDLAGWVEGLEAFADAGHAAQMGKAARAWLMTHWQGTDAPHIISPEINAWVTA